VKLQEWLLAPGGCPWDREQTHETLRTYLIEECYEVLEAIESGDPAKLREELGDLLLQVVFHAQLAKQAGKFDIAEVARGIHEKLVRRHPHVFGEVKAKTAGQVLKNWEQLKAAERAQKKQEAESLLDGVPHTLPALLEAYQMTRRAARIGFDWDDIGGILEKVKEEAREVAEAAAVKSPRVEEEVGDLLFAAVNMARFLGIDPEIALKKANRKFQGRFREMEKHMDRKGRKLAQATRQEMEDLWDRSKASA
jgi:MazG family protein